MTTTNPPEGDNLVADNPASQRPAAAIAAQEAVGVSDAREGSERSTLRIADIVPGVSCGDAALAFHAAGFAVIPILPHAKRPPFAWGPWLDGLSEETIAAHWRQNPDHELGCIVGDDLIVLDADSPQSFAALFELEKSFDVEPRLVHKTRKGEHHFFRVRPGTKARSNSHSTEAHPERIDVKTGRAIAVLPPSTNKTITRCDIDTAADLTIVGQDFIDAVFRHNGAEPPREHAVREPRDLSSASRLATVTLPHLAAMLDQADPDCGYEDWCTILMAAHHDTGGSEAGFALVNEWSARGRKYCGERELRAKWRSFDGYTGKPITVGTLKHYLAQRGKDVAEICAAAEPQFELCGHESVEPTPRPPSDQASRSIPELVPDAGAASDQELSPALILTAYSLVGSLKKLKKEMLEQKRLLDGIALIGQATVLYAAPNTGKTLLVLWMLIQAIKEGRVDPSNVFYINCDDSMNGLVQKLELAERYGFHMLAEGHEGFEARIFLQILNKVISSGQAKGVVIVLDTLKKFADLMDKRISSNFMTIVRKFVLKGGTAILLAHTNKRPGPDGKPIFAGTSDVRDDVDGGYIMWVTSEPGAAEKVVQFENIKSRGNVRQQATFAYRAADGVSYLDRLASVRQVDDAEAVVLEAAAELRSDAEFIATVRACIGEGIVKRMDLMVATGQRSKCGRRKAQDLLDKYTGTDSLQHHWTFDVQARGAKVYRLLAPDAASTSTPLEPGHE